MLKQLWILYIQSKLSYYKNYLLPLKDKLYNERARLMTLVIKYRSEVWAELLDEDNNLGKTNRYYMNKYLKAIKKIDEELSALS